MPQKILMTMWLAFGVKLQEFFNMPKILREKNGTDILGTLYKFSLLNTYLEKERTHTGWFAIYVCRGT